MNALSRSLIFALLALLTLSFSSMAHAEPKSEPMRYIKDGYQTVIDVFEKDKVARDAALSSLLAASLDYDDLARRSLGKHWEPLTPEQQKLYNELFHQLLERTYVKALSHKSPNTNYTLEWDDERKEGKNAHVVVIALFEDTETEIDFFLTPKGDGWLIHDMTYDGASVEKTYQKNHGKIIEEEGFDALAAKMRERIAKLK